MQYRLSTLGALGLAGQAFGAFIPSEPWSTLTPKAPAPTGAITDYSSTFAIAVQPITSGSLKKREAAVTQIGDGQIQAATTTTSTAAKKTAQVVSQIGDGQIQATTKTTKAPKTTAQVVTQIGDGQIQATTKTAKTTAQVVTQIGDGQIQATTKTAAQVVTQIGDGQIQATTKTAAQVVTQIGDGQIQATTKTTAQVVTQIGDGQIQATTATTKTAQVVSQITDGQIQATTKTATGASQITDGQVQATTAAAASDDSTDPVDSVSCKTADTLSMTLNGSVLTDSKGRIGSIVANRQFQFDGPPPQAGAIYAAGWSITTEGNLAIGNTSTFYQCLSGSFYNLYDESIGDQCTEVHLEVVDLIDC